MIAREILATLRAWGCLLFVLVVVAAIGAAVVHVWHMF